MGSSAAPVKLLRALPPQLEVAGGTTLLLVRGVVEPSGWGEGVARL
jgi:hypothetical protein